VNRVNTEPFYIALPIVHAILHALCEHVLAQVVVPALFSNHQRSAMRCLTLHLQGDINDEYDLLAGLSDSPHQQID
jgi:hypothetical protein